eukprot:TRINITY_DN65783_c0_g1_i1.p1 TRINITY_DN65783_c0_g1~~TRINITY_DN65783_c0_g1_i1.p1  ORF type:complete len:402 (+),score=70.46 TRINITY_DN65783_c0_g1_i1:250-1455(+)
MDQGEPRAPPGMPPVAFGAPAGSSRPGALPSVREGNSLQSEQEEMLAQLGLNPLDWDDEPEAEAEDVTSMTAGYGRAVPSLERSLSESMTITRGAAGGVRKLSVSSIQPSEPARNASGLGETLSSPSAVHGQSVTWVRGEVLGRGSLGIVFKALDQQTGRMFAVKEVIIDLKDDEDMRFKEALQNEISICKDLHHPRIVSYLGHDSIDSCLYVYMEYMPGGSLAEVLAQFGSLDESLIAIYTQELLEGLQYLHTREPPVVHRDIKGANVLVGMDSQVKLADFGCSKRNSDTMSRTMKGSIPWMAPEVIKNTGYGRAADIWSFGCVLLEMASQEGSPWGKFDNPVAAMFKIAMSKELPPIPESLSEVCRAFVRRCIQREPSDRPTATELLEDEFVRDLLLDD